MNKIRTNIFTLMSFFALVILLLSFTFILISQVYNNRIEKFILNQNHILFKYTGNRDSLNIAIQSIDEVNYSTLKSLSSKQIIAKTSLLKSMDSTLIDPIIMLNFRSIKDTKYSNLTLNKLASLEGVSSVYYNSKINKVLLTNWLRLNYSIWFILIIFTLFAYTIIYNNVKYALLEQKSMFQKLKVMGASNAFFKKPFYIKGLLLTVVATMSVIVLLISISKVINIEIVDLLVVQNIGIGFIILGFGLIIILSSIHISFKKHLITRDDDLF